MIFLIVAFVLIVVNTRGITGGGGGGTPLSWNSQRSLEVKIEIERGRLGGI